MARIVDDLPSPDSRPKYPWDEWLDGHAWQLLAGQDYSPNPTVMRQMIYDAARRRGKKASVHIDGDAITLQAHERQP